MSHNSFGHLFRFTTWGESHGPSIGCVIDGTPPRIELSENDIQKFLNKRKPGQSKFTSPRKESDEVKILSGVIEEDGRKLTTGTPISLIIENTDQRSKDYSEIEEKFRPGHADYTYFSKYGIRDVRGGGRQSARETAMRVAAGAIARKILPEVEIKGALVQLGEHKINRENWDDSFTEKNAFWSPDPSSIDVWEKYIEDLIKAGDSCGAIIEITAKIVFTSTHSAACMVIAKRISKSDWKGDIICTGYFFMVAIDNQMRPIPIPQFIPKTDEEKELWNKAKSIREEMIK